MQAGHEECAHEIVEEKTLSAAEPFITTLCLHDHKDPIVIGEDLCNPETVGWHCHCCGRVWVDQTYVQGARP